ncbi:hypothetical protein KBI23_17410 [bacterium]|nr:hypothetical protein [bacterium]MBP9809894.1 hypothetical protein [bacterium]
MHAPARKLSLPRLLTLYLTTMTATLTSPGLTQTAQASDTKTAKIEQNQSQNQSSSHTGALSSDTTVHSLAHMPVQEVTVFKDGHALLIHEGLMPLTASGDVVLEDLPKPVLGTFFPYSMEPQAKLGSVTSGRRKITNSQTALTLPELIAANAGAMVRIDELIGVGEKAKLVSYDAKIIGIPTRSAEELARAGQERLDPTLILPQKSSLVKLKTDTGTTYIPIDRIQTLSFKSEPDAQLKDEYIRNTLTMALDWQKRGNTKARVGMMYLEKGIRWIPNYKVTIDGQGHAKVKLQATIVNDLTDLKDVNCNLVVGVPSFAFKGDIDPISLSETLAHVASYAAQDSRLRNSFSNAIMSQSVGYASDKDEEKTGAAQTSSESSKNEDLFVFNLKHLTLKKGERMVVPVQEYTVDYKDLYTFDLAIAPPPEVQSQNNHMVNSGKSDEQKLADSNKIIHKIRLFNSSKQPFTTAPALIVVTGTSRELSREPSRNPGSKPSNWGNDGEVLAQGMMTYASPGSNADLTLTNAVDIKAKKEEKETSRTADAVTWQDYKYARVNLAGTITLTNYMNKPVTVEITRKVLGRLDSVSKGGIMTMTNTIDEIRGSDLPPWWGYFSWPGWWSYMNGIGKFTFTETIQPGKSINVDYGWHYFWR